MGKHHDVGKRGEDLAAQFLEEKGYTILARNWKRQHAEIDIIASYENYLVFVEVKTRSSDVWGDPLDAVSKQKMNQIIKGASIYIENNDAESLDVRFDVISIVLKGDQIDIEHIDDAFYPTLD